VEHAALARKHRIEEEERQREWRKAEVRRRREEEYESREKRRMEFADAIHGQLALREKLKTVLAHLESAAGDDAKLAAPMAAWLRRRIRQIDALISPCFLDLSARTVELAFDEPPPENRKDDDDRSYRYLKSVALEYWSLDDEKG